MIGIRQGNPQDARELLALLKEMHAEAPIALPPVDDGKSLARIADACCLGVALIAFDSATAETVGALILESAQDWYATSLFLSDLAFYVRPAHRASRAAHLLKRAACEISDNSGLPLRLAVFNGEDVDRKDRFFERSGFKRVGGFYVRGM